MLNVQMYALAFDLDTKAMKAAGLSESEQVSIYQTELPKALEQLGFTRWMQGSIYSIDSDIKSTGILAKVHVIPALRRLAPQFCTYAKHVHLFRVEGDDDIAAKLRG